MINLKVYKNMPFRVIVKKNRYYDLIIDRSISEDTTESFEMTPYEGLAITFYSDGWYISVKEGVFADGTPHVNEKQFALVAKGQTAVINDVEMAGVMRSGENFTSGGEYFLYHYKGDFFVSRAGDIRDDKYDWCGCFSADVSYFPEP